MPRDADPQIVIVDIDEKSLRREGHWPWPRDKLARLVDQLFDRYGARSSASTSSFPRPTPRAASRCSTISRTPSSRERAGIRRDDRAGCAASSTTTRASRRRCAAGPSVLAFTFTMDVQRAGALPAPRSPRPTLGGHDIPIATEHGYAANLADPAARRRRAAGHLDPLFDSDNVVRRVPLVKRYEGGFYPALSLAIAQTVVEGEGDPSRTSTATATSMRSTSPGSSCRSRATARRSSPIADRQKSFRYYSATDILAGNGSRRRVHRRDRAGGDDREGPADLRSTPLAPDYPGVEIHANLRRRHAERGAEIGAGRDAADRGADHAGRGPARRVRRAVAASAAGRARHRRGRRDGDRREPVVLAARQRRRPARGDARDAARAAHVEPA